MESLGETVPAEGIAWERVRDPDTTEGYVRRQYLIAVATPISEVIKPSPVRTPVSERDPDVRAYVDYMVPRLTVIAQALASIGRLSGQVADRPALLADSGWRAQTVVTLALLNAYEQQIQAYEPVPPRLQAVDALMVSIGRDLTYVVTEFAEGMDSLDAGRLGNAASRLELATAKMERATAEVTALQR